MLFHKHPYPANFAFASDLRPGKARIGGAKIDFAVRRLRDDVWHVAVSGPAGWAARESQAELDARPAKAGKTSLELLPGGGWVLRGSDGATLLEAPAGRALGKCGEASLFAFAAPEGARYYGLGEKMFGMERSGLRTNFWNTDVAADFHWRVWSEENPDPMYVSVPYLLVQVPGRGWVGLLLDNPFMTFACTAAEKVGRPDAGGHGAEDRLQAAGDEPLFWMGAYEGRPELYVIPGASAREVTRKLQALVGRTPMPPAWALGYHQCRWGYEKDQDLEMLNEELARYGFPCDALWLDIEYMDGYRVFSWNKAFFPDIAKTTAALERKFGRKLVPILDPGVKNDDAYGPKKDGDKADVWCRTPEGTPFIGRVWPGDTLFPDFSIGAGRAWWRDHLAKWARESGVAGAWLDMNDPATAHVDYDAMRFDRGLKPHSSFHNQYATGMARASREGFLKARPGERPFMICRSGFIGHNRYSAIWTGDNSSNAHYLQASIPCSVNLSLSGVPFNAPDAGGFMGNTTPQLMVDWYKAGFLFPFFRNHSCRGTIRQEPWNFDSEYRSVLLEYTRLRYKMRPYLYQLFAQQEEVGDPILRPVFYEFDSTPGAKLERLDAEFMVGPAVLQRPQVAPAVPVVVLPPGGWYSTIDRAWVEGDRTFEQWVGRETTPIYFREGEIVPMQPGEIGADHRWDGAKVELHVFLRRPREGVATKRAAGTDYVFDDGHTLDYRKGARSQFSVHAEIAEDGTLAISTALVRDGYGPAKAVSFVLYDDFPAVTVNGRKATPKAAKLRFAGAEQAVWTVR